jgi:hypothetical protein
MEWLKDFIEYADEFDVMVAALVGVLGCVLTLLGVAIKSYVDLRKGKMVLRVEAEGQFRTDYLHRLELVEKELRKCQAQHLDCEQRAIHLEARIALLEQNDGH